MQQAEQKETLHQIGITSDRINKNVLCYIKFTIIVSFNDVNLH